MENTGAQSIVQYGVLTLASKTVLLMTDQLAEAERILEVVGEGRILERTVQYGPWRTARSLHEVQQLGGVAART